MQKNWNPCSFFIIKNSHKLSGLLIISSACLQKRKGNDGVRHPESTSEPNRASWSEARGSFLKIPSLHSNKTTQSDNFNSRRRICFLFKFHCHFLKETRLPWYCISLSPRYIVPLLWRTHEEPHFKRYIDETITMVQLWLCPCSRMKSKLPSC